MKILVMHEDRVIHWLRNHQKVMVQNHGIAAGLYLVASSAILLGTWVITYLVTHFITDGFLDARSFWGQWLPCLMAWFMMPLVFWSHARIDRDELSQYSVTANSPDGKVVCFYLPDVGMVSNVNPLAPDTVHAAVKMIVDALLWGPRCVDETWGHFQKMKRLQTLDVETCGALLSRLVRASGKVSFQEMMHITGESNLRTLLPQMLLMEGVLFLPSEPAGLTLLPELRLEILNEA